MHQISHFFVLLIDLEATQGVWELTVHVVTETLG